MANDERASANNTGLPELLSHIDDMQNKAWRLEAVLEAINYLENEGQCENGRQSLSMIAQEMAQDIANGLDIQRLTEVRT
ncbi:hypothetical protein [Pseudooceanicola sp.]|uniref:hypothetical protein n=1 Tax=Pseudooceanicola sp. TaxID=1914328 RepID=UPI003512536D